MSEFRFKKKYGQNFLRNNSIVDKIVNSINPEEKDLIIEIGPGSGAITRRLKQYGANLIAFEIDEDTKKFLNDLEDEKTHIVYKDFLTVDLKSFLKDYTYDKLYIIGNLPYYITTPIIEHIIDSQIEVESITIMVQKEVAERFLSPKGNREYGYMTVLLNYNYSIKKIVDVSKDNFEPKPKVDSTVVELTKRKKENIDYIKFKQILKESFQFKRKTIKNNLSRYNSIVLEDILKSRGYTLNSRAEEIDLDTFLEMTKKL